jgi:hypothetical protein
MVALTFGDKKLSLAMSLLDILPFKNFVVYGVHDQLYTLELIYNIIKGTEYFVSL